MTGPRLTSLAAGIGCTAGLLLFIGAAYGPRALAAGVALLVLGWLVHDDAPPRPPSNSTP